MSIIITIPDQLHEDLIVTALEGGSNYWYFLSDEAYDIIKQYAPLEPLSIKFWKAIQQGAVIPIHDAEDEENKIGEISLASIEKGEQLLANKHLNYFTEILGESWDAISADVWFQYCTLGEIVYG